MGHTYISIRILSGLTLQKVVKGCLPTVKILTVVMGLKVFEDRCHRLASGFSAWRRR